MISMIRVFLVMILAVCGGAVQAQELSALARLDATRSFIRDQGCCGLAIDLHLSQAVPYRVFTLDDPMRLVVDFREVDWGGISPAALLEGQNTASGVRFGLYRPGWSRMVVDLKGPMAVQTAGMVTDPSEGEATVQLRLIPSAQAEFSAASGAPASAMWGEPKIADMPLVIQRRTGEGPLVVVLDPGHGGLDPGAQTGGASEAQLMLTFARELKEVLTRAGGFTVVMTRNEDVFVPLETRVSIARAAGADVFISLHADALTEGHAAGATVYTLSETASDEASAKLAERHERNDLLAGVDLSAQDDVIAGVLMDLARLETAPRAGKLADHLVIGIRDAVGKMYKRPRQEAGFSVLKAPDIPSVLIELGFLSSAGDLENLLSPEWRSGAADGIRAALAAWAITDAAEAQLLRQ
ncbi:MAG: N-acetylmuramoyl-L-alanine amidase [Marinosulfonomonas sp.]|nr:MAG: N-acetylmuramoyl-L-alanine amidase [Marinosulfonomonas sp.]